jgi:hypothetical protein
MRLIVLGDTRSEFVKDVELLVCGVTNRLCASIPSDNDVPNRALNGRTHELPISANPHR